MLKVIEVLAESYKSSEDTAQVAVTKAAQLVRKIKSIYFKDTEATVENDQVVKCRTKAKSFLLED